MQLKKTKTFSPLIFPKAPPHQGASQFTKNPSYILTPPFNKGRWGGENYDDKQISLSKQDTITHLQKNIGVKNLNSKALVSPSLTILTLFTLNPA
ncbi:hypothetical protein, partial [Limnofasciculus baicalensis]